MTKISVIIPAYNSAKTIVKTIEAIKEQIGLSEQPEIIVVDDGSKDETLEILNKFKNITVIAQNNSGPATARNAGAKMAKGDILVFTDSDTVPHNNWLKELTSPFENREIKASTGTYSIANPKSRLAQLIQSEIEFKHSKYGEFVLFGGSYNLAIRKSLFNEIGGFNEEYKSASGEDNDICYKTLNKGYKIKFVKEAIVGHYHPENIVKYLKTQMKHGYWRAKLYFDHLNKVSGDDYTGYKEILESLLAGSLFLLPILVLFNSTLNKRLRLASHYRWIFKIMPLVLIMALFLLELLYVYKLYSKKDNKTLELLPSILYASLLFFLRAICRILGFAKGIVGLRFFML